MGKLLSRRVDWRECRRFRALALKREGWTHEEVAEALDVSKAAVSKGMKQVADQGEVGLRAKPRTGATARLTDIELVSVPELLADGAEAYDFRGEVWTCRRVAQVIQWEFGVQYHRGHVARLLKTLGWTPQWPVVRATQQDEKKVARWCREVGPALKKRPSANAATWSA
jgi:transposase